MVSDIFGRFMRFPLTLAVQCGSPVLVILFLGKRLLIAGHPLRLPLLAWLFSLPLNIAALTSIGGSINNLHGFQLLVAPLVVFLFTRANLRAFRLAATTAAMIGAIALVRTLGVNRVSLLPVRSVMEDAMSIERQFPNEVWLPWNPLVSYYSEGRFYHTLDGMLARSATGFPVPESQFLAHMPPRFHTIAYCPDGLEWSEPSRYAKQPFSMIRSGDWVVMDWLPASEP